MSVKLYIWQLHRILVLIQVFINIVMLGNKYSFVEIDPEILSRVILSLPLIQEGQLSVSGKRMCTVLVNCFED